MSDKCSVDVHIERLLSLLDKNPLSKTYGSFQRDFWHYKMVADFPSAVYQAGAFSLALAYKDKNSIFYHKAEVLKHIKASIAYWQNIQHLDGSFSEWYPFERSIVATAFTLYFITETCLLLKDDLDVKELVSAKVLLKSATFLTKNIDTTVINHTAGALAALYNVYLLTGEKKCLLACEKNKKVLLSQQNAEGWFYEYGQPDAGYQSLSIFFLASYYKKSKDEEIYASLEKGLNFLASFVHPDKTAGGIYMSRNTDYVFRYGLLLCCEYFDVAAYILNNIDFSKIVNETVADDRYFVFFFLPDALLSNKKHTSLNIAYKPSNGFFENSGLLVRSLGDFSLFMNLKKGGSLKIFKKDKLIFSSAGYIYDNQGKLFSTQGFSHSHYKGISGESLVIDLRADFQQVSNVTYSTFFLLGFKIFNLTLCRIGFIDMLFSKLLKKYKILKTKKAKGYLKRRVYVSTEGISLKDNIYELPVDKRCFHMASSFLKFVPSSAYFSQKNAFLEENFVLVDKKDNDGSVCFEKKIN